ncbi:antigen 5 like allergen Cul n 1-like [Anopheles ziemanni]|uniref:antigen 5 like allergen Cul n 1-like n=1 Tax=Anopheles coustani TaxID=139045 RepID=UPI002659F615|nr:antigen 5 like allergen Cul n 1-like [Anopheles coustani]XP_058175579.1 antigen 5 like allergen Cul n 1-like [Anopheles ziemanni]
MALFYLHVACWLLFVGFVFPYRDDKYCHICKNHVACEAVDKLHGKCLTFSDVNLTILNHYQHQITDHVNHLREKFALGHVNGFHEKYGPMHTVTWDPEMADLCRFNLHSCEFAHDKCRGTPHYPYSGQTLGKLTKCVPNLKTQELKINVLHNVVLHLVDHWFAEHEVTKASDVTYYSRHSSDRKLKIGHFLQLINCNVCKLGCSLISYRDYRKHDVCDTYILCCNYSYINIVNRPICAINRYPDVCEKDKKFHGLCQHCPA